MQAILDATADFYPRPPGGGRQLAAAEAATAKVISIHALRVEGDYKTCHICIRIDQISIHALRVEGDLGHVVLVDGFGKLFLSTPSGWRATGAERRGPAAGSYFYPRPPGGGRHPRNSV